MEKIMKLSNETLTVLKNFSAINAGIQFKQGNTLSTMSTGKTVLAKAVLKDSFPQEFCISDLNQFLSVNSLFKDIADIEFEDANVIFKNGRSKIRYRTTAKEMIVIPPANDIPIIDPECTFTLTAEDYAWIMKTSNVLSSPNIAVVSDGEKIEILSYDSKDNSASTNTIEVGTGNGKSYRIVFKTENIKMVEGSYDVQISFKGFGHFKNTKDDIQYWVAFESKDSKTS
jgi:hypothetical protein